MAERIAHSLRGEGDEVFFDRESLPVGEIYDSRIRQAIEGSDLFVFLVEPAAIAAGSYALAELGIAERARSRGPLKVLPVMIADTDFAAMPAFLRGITVLQPRGDAVAETLAAIADVRGELRREQVSVSVMPSNSSWLVNFYLDDQPRELFYRFGEETEFRSTGFSQVPDRRTGRPQPRMFAAVPPFEGERELYVKYTDVAGREHGPYRLIVNSTEQLVAFTKQVLETTRPWVSFREYPEGKWLAYFTHLLAYQKALREIRYSVDDESLSSRVGADAMISIPAATRYVCVQLVFADGSEWPPERVNR